MRPTASIIIPVRDLLGSTRRCLESVRLHTGVPHEIIVIDNASRPPTRDYLRRASRGAGLRVVHNPRNLSFAASINQGMRLSRGGLIIWLNNDSVVGPEWLERLQAGLGRFPEAGAIGPCTNDPLSGSGRGARHAPLPRDMPAFASAWSLRFQQQAEEAGMLSGFCLALRRGAMEAVGLLDERFLWGEEDLDYCLRLRLAGFKLILARDVFVYHQGGGTRGKWGKARREAFQRGNRALFHRKWVRLTGELSRVAHALLG